MPPANAGTRGLIPRNWTVGAGTALPDGSGSFTDYLPCTILDEDGP
jgi:hypothetical protein